MNQDRNLSIMPMEELYRELEKRGWKDTFIQEEFDKKYKKEHGRKDYNHTIDKDGFVKAEHRVIWEHHFGEIPKGMIIHHINGDSKDNRIENLQMVNFGHTKMY